MDSLPHPLVWSCEPNPSPPCTPPAQYRSATAHITSCPHRFLEHASIWIVSISDMRSNLPRSISCMACASLQPLISRMLRVLMESPGGSRFWRRVGGGAVCRQSAPWWVDREKLIGILIKEKKQVKRRKIPVLATVESTAVLLGGTPLLRNGRGQARAVVYDAAGR